MPSISFSQAANVSSGPAKGVFTVEAAKLVEVDESTGAETTTGLSVPLDVSALVALFILTDGDVTISFVDALTNEVGTVAMLRGRPFFWYDGCGMDLPLGDDVATIAVDNAAVDPVRVQLFALIDPTP